MIKYDLYYLRQKSNAASCRHVCNNEKVPHFEWNSRRRAISALYRILVEGLRISGSNVCFYRWLIHRAFSLAWLLSFDVCPLKVTNQFRLSFASMISFEAAWHIFGKASNLWIKTALVLALEMKIKFPLQVKVDSIWNLKIPCFIFHLILEIMNLTCEYSW